MPVIRKKQMKRNAKGFSLVELLIAVTISLVVLGALATMFAGSSRSASEIERSNRQIENGQYSLQVLRDDLEHAGYWGQFDIGSLPVATGGFPAAALPAALPDPCNTALATLQAAMPLHVQGVDNGPLPAGCAFTDGVVAGQDILVVRRVSTCATGPDCPAVDGATYFQASSCNDADELRNVNWLNFFRLSADRDAVPLDRTALNCTDLAEERRYLVHIYFVRNFYRTSGDGMATLVRAEFGPDGFELVPIANGVEAMQLEYGIDTNGDGAPNAYTANPSTFNGCAAAGCELTNWLNVMSVRVHLLARSPTPSVGYTDDKSYVLGLDVDGAPNVVLAANDGFRRHVFQGVVRLTNASIRR